MSRACTVCAHPDYKTIDQALLAGQSLRNIAARFGTSRSALHRHAHFHLPAESQSKPTSTTRWKFVALVVVGFIVARAFLTPGGNVPRDFSGGPVTMRVALYARVSTQDKDQNPETQLFPLREFATAQGWEATSEFVDRAPATDMRGRTDWRKLLDRAA